MDSVAVIGASLAGLRAIETLRKEGFDGQIWLVGDEGELPYDRPPLSKQVLSGEWTADQALLTTHESLDELGVTRFLRDPAVGLTVEPLAVSLASGLELMPDGVIIATGARPRTIDTPLAGVHTLRTLEDAAAVAAAMQDMQDAGSPNGAGRVVVVGGGFIGAEVAAAARGRDLDVTLVEMAEVPFERALGADVGGVVADVHREHGVDVRTGVGCAGFQAREDDAGHVGAVELTDGSIVEADLVVVGIGVIPNINWLLGSDLTLDNGVCCDETLLAAPGIVAAGDVAEWSNPRFGEVLRVEHWDNAVTSGQHAARRLLHGEAAGAYDPVPWFWSDQYDRKIQLAGRTTGFDSFQVVEGDFASRRFAAIYGRDGVFTAVVGMNRPRHVIKYRQLLTAGATWDEALAAEI